MRIGNEMGAVVAYPLADVTVHAPASARAANLVIPRTQVASCRHDNSHAGERRRLLGKDSKTLELAHSLGVSSSSGSELLQAKPIC